MLKLQLYSRRVSITVWTIVLCIFMGIGLSEASFVTGESAEGFEELFQMLPSYMMAMYGMNTISFTDLAGFYGIMITFMIIGVSINAILTTNGLFVNEQVDKTFEYSLTRPFTREHIATSKILGATIVALIINVAIAIISFIVSLFFEDDIALMIIITSSLVFIGSLFFIGICGIILYIVPNYKHVLKLNLAILVIFYMLFVMYQMFNEDYEFLFYLSPFSLFGAENYLDDRQLLIPIVIGLLTYICGFMLGRKSLNNKQF